MALTSGNPLGALILEEISHNYNHKAVVVQGSAGLVVGSILEAHGTDGDYQVCSTAASASALSLETETIASGTTGTIVALLRGPAVVKRAGVQYGALDADTVNTALKNLNIIILDEPSNVQEGP